MADMYLQYGGYIFTTLRIYIYNMADICIDNMADIYIDNMADIEVVLTDHVTYSTEVYCPPLPPLVARRL